MKHWTFEINESDSGEILISADGSDGSRWQEWINKKEGKLYESNLESMGSHKVTPVEDWAIRTEINLMMHLLATYFQKDMQNVESYQIFEGNVLYQKPDPAKRDSEGNLFRIDHTWSDSKYGTVGDFSFWVDSVENDVPDDFLPDWDRNDALDLIGEIAKEVIPDSGYPSDGETW